METLILFAQSEIREAMYFISNNQELATKELAKRGFNNVSVGDGNLAIKTDILYFAPESGRLVSIGEFNGMEIAV